jgi:hypothetical protein
LPLQSLLIGHWLHLLPGDAHAERFLDRTLGAKGYEPVASRRSTKLGNV